MSQSAPHDLDVLLWFPEHLDSGWRDIYAADSVKARRNWFRALEDSDQI